MKPQKILNDVRKVMGKEDIVISDVGAIKCGSQGIITVMSQIPVLFPMALHHGNCCSGCIGSQADQPG